jgi:phosphopantetheine--protein transferase-like protein
MNIFKNISLGNDVIDFLDPDTVDLKRNIKFLNRVFTESELNPIQKNTNADTSDDYRHLWRMWAAKEASYKAIKRLNPEIVFSPRLFEFNSYNPSLQSGFVNYNGKNAGKIKIKFIENNDYIHALATINIEISDVFKNILFGNFNEIQEELKQKTLLESYSMESSLCRTWAACRLIDLLGANQVNIVKNQNQGNVPEIWVDGKKTNHLISFSHHGRYCGIFFFRGSLILN